MSNAVKHWHPKNNTWPNDKLGLAGRIFIVPTPLMNKQVCLIARYYE